MQQPPYPLNPAPPHITTEQIQKMLDENKQLILAILENQNLGKFAECVQYQAQLQKNLLYLAAIADAQPQAPTARPQMVPHVGMQPGGHAQQAPFLSSRPSLQFSPQQHLLQQPQQSQQQHQLIPLQGHMGIRPGSVNGMHPMHTDVSYGGSSEPPPAASLASTDGRGKQDTGATSESAAVEGQRNAGAEHGNENPETGHPKRPDYTKTP